MGERGKNFVEILAVVLILNICSFFSFGEPTRLVKIELIEVLSIGSLDDDTLFMWAGIAVDEESNIYVTDALDYSLKKFDADGQLVKRIGRKGQGPGEFIAPRLLTASPDFLFSTDQSVPGIQVFDLDLKFQRRIAYKWPISSIKALSNDRIAIISFALGEGCALSLLDYAGKIVDTVKYSAESNVMLLNSADFTYDYNRNLYLAYSFQDKIEKLDASTKSIWSRKILNIKEVKKQQIKPFVVPTEVTYKSICLDRSERLYVLGGHLSENPSRDIYVLDREGELTASITLPEPSHCIYIDHQDFLYSRANEGITLKKYLMVVK